MKGKYQSDDDVRVAAGSDPVGGTYIDASGGKWTVTVSKPDGGTGYLTWLAQLDNRERTWFGDQDRDRLFRTVDEWVAKQGAGGGALWLVAIAIALVLTDGKRRR